MQGLRGPSGASEAHVRPDDQSLQTRAQERGVIASMPNITPPEALAMILGLLSASSRTLMKRLDAEGVREGEVKALRVIGYKAADLTDCIRALLREGT